MHLYKWRSRLNGVMSRKPPFAKRREALGSLLCLRDRSCFRRVCTDGIYDNVFVTCNIYVQPSTLCILAEQLTYRAACHGVGAFRNEPTHTSF